MPRTFEDKPGVRVSGNVKIGIMGPSGGGKTWSALRLATGIQRVVGGDIGVIDTESGRALSYSDFFKFRHLDFQPPFRSLDYLDAMRHYVDKGVKTIVVDSMTHEHAGPGGYLEYAEAELDRMAGDNYGKRQACKMASFIKPSGDRRKMIDGILQLKANFIFCYRAKEKIKPVKDRSGKTEIENQGFMPVAGTELVFEMDACCLLLPHAGGVPTWQSDESGEKMMIKTARQFDKIFEKAQPLSEDIGEQLAIWARGKPVGTTQATQQPASQPGEPDPDLKELEKQGDGAASCGLEQLRVWWNTVPAETQKLLRVRLDTVWKPKAAAVSPS